MKIALGIKSDPIEYRYSFSWLFDLMKELGVSNLQLGSFFELYYLDDSYFTRLRNEAESRGIRIRSCFTAHRELGGFFTGDPDLERVARRCYERYIEIAALLGAEYVGSNPGSVFRDQMDEKPHGISRYVSHMHELTVYAAELGLLGLTIEPMSSLAEPPALPHEIRGLIEEINSYQAPLGSSASRVPARVCGDVSHGLVDRDGHLLHDHEELFSSAIPWMVEFHFKNSDARYESTFGFGNAAAEGGVVDLERIRTLIDESSGLFPVDELVGYLEIGGPKLGRDYSDPMLSRMIAESVDAIRSVFGSI